jgi:hypothetical protein
MSVEICDKSNAFGVKMQIEIFSRLSKIKFVHKKKSRIFVASFNLEYYFYI